MAAATWNVPTIRTPVSRWTVNSQHFVALSMPCGFNMASPEYLSTDWTHDFDYGGREFRDVA